MGFRSRIIRPFANKIARDIQRWSAHAVQEQEQIFNRLIEVGKTTAFGKAHGFDQIRSYQDYIERVPIRDYEGIKPYIERIKAGENDVLWRGKPAYFAKTSGTTSGVKYIPISKDSIPNHFGSARNALFNYFAQTGNGTWLDGKLIFLSGSPELGETAGIPTGRLSGISNHMIPAWLRTNQMPSYETNCIEDWETKLDKIVTETLSQNMTLISGIPPWVQMYYERLLDRSGKKKGAGYFSEFFSFCLRRGQL
ncbi:MAG: GH3 auxin-responsive promoter family protein [Haliscomenobacter sp.]|nr:GH3 auxin-responsive promoter family protein [Haliscomenobacter sp.]MDX2069499.1 GH3 auxin-responsive promoter family protein [Haliscomenobacter sp.]